jgi:hypothetical protein
MTTPSSIELESIQAQDVMVSQLELARKKLKQPKVNFSGRLTAITVADTMTGSSTLTVTLFDPDHSVLDSGFFDCREDGKLDAIEVNYPVGTKNWWRLTDVELNADHKIVMTLMERIAVEMQGTKGPYQTSRGKKTRAQFIQTLVSKSDKSATFVCKELTKHQRTQRDPTVKVTAADRRRAKDGGLPRDAGLKINRHVASGGPKGQLAQAETALDVATQLNAPTRAVEAMMCAGIGESEFKCVVNSLGYGGVFQGQVNVGGHYFSKDDTAEMAKYFLKGGKGFQGGGAIEQASKHPDKSPGMIAADVEKSYPNTYLPTAAAAEHHYQQYLGEARKLIEAYGGGGFGGATYHLAYNFKVGDTNNPHETFWDAAQRLADEVRWALFIDGDHVYYDSEQTLIGQAPVATIERDGPYVVDWSGSWDERHIATEVVLTLVCDPFEFRAGEVFLLKGFGPYSTGSTATPKRPGYWLISETSRAIGGLATEFTLKQPQNPKREPRSETAQRSAGTGVTANDLMDAMAKISRLTPGYDHFPPSESHARTFKQMKPSQEFDCSSSCSYALWLAKMFDGDAPITSGTFAATWGKAGRGSDFTVWANSGHVFMQSEGGAKWRFDTGGPGGGRGAKLHRGGSAIRPTDGFTPRHWPGS